jgi:hypothetical protein
MSYKSRRDVSWLTKNISTNFTANYNIFKTENSLINFVLLEIYFITTDGND